MSLRQLLLRRQSTVRARLQQRWNSNLARESSSSTTAPASAATTSASKPRKQSRFARAMGEMKKKPGTHLTSFLILHEATAVVPLFPLYYFFQWTDLSASFLGGPMVGTIGHSVIPSFVPQSLGGGRKVEEVVTEWIDELARTVARVGTRYGIMGFHKVQQLRGKEKEIVEEEGANALQRGMKGINAGVRGKISETVSGVSVRNVMDAVAAYAIVKALLPIRLALSVGATPWFASRVVGPCINAIRRNKTPNAVT